MRVRLLVSGRVQGVGFREFTRRTAHRLGVGGWVRNLSDGRVEVVADGERPALDALVNALSGGPPGAFVRTVHQDWGAATAAGSPAATGEGEFEIR
ncbi:MAG TPA: acylphosphatase [bacterium]|nr:acylphosphatase [bacterium]